MRDILPDIRRWRQAGRKVAVATIVKVWGSAPRPLGSKMAVADDGAMAGSVSGGCVEGAVFEEAQGVLARDVPKLVPFGVSNEEAWAVGLSCGGEIEVFVEPLDPTLHDELEPCLDDERLVAVATALTGPGAGRHLLLHGDGTRRGGLGSQALDQVAAGRLRELFASLSSERHAFELEDGSVDVFLEVHPPRPLLVVVGAVHAAIPLVEIAKLLGFRTVVVDPRTAFATRDRFPHADELLTDWPDEALTALGLHENTFVALLSHDLKLDLPALRVALPGKVRYIGALGSKKTHGKRVTALREAGFDEHAIARIHNPIGLDLGGRRAEEIALAVAAEMVAVDHGRTLEGRPG